RTAHIIVAAPSSAPPDTVEGIMKEGMAWWPLAMARQLDDAILTMRTNDLDIGTWILSTRGDAANVLKADATLQKDNWFIREVVGMLRRTLARLEVTSRTLFALIEPGTCFAGTLLELALAADRTYMLQVEENGPSITLSEMNFGAYPMVNRLSRIGNRFY